MIPSVWWFLAIKGIHALRFSQEYVGYNLNENETAINPLDYYGEWENHTYNPSPKNWRFPIYSIFLDKWVNGDPSNDNANGTQFEHDSMQTQLRHGGDLQGLIDSLDYIQGMGAKGIYIAGSPFINKPWGADAYSPLDFTLLDQHFGDIAMYRKMTTEVHKRGMYVIADNTMATMGNLNGFVGYLNATVPFSLEEHEVIPVDPMFQYHDFHPGNTYNKTCAYPRFWLETGYLIPPETEANFTGCYDSEFDQYGDTEAFGVHPDWQRQLSRFASVQDRLREWVPSVREKIEHFSCLQIRMLDIDGFRLDKATQITVDALGDFSQAMRECARSVGKENFFIPGEITGGNTFGSIYLGRGRQPDMLPTDLVSAVTMTNASNSSLWIRDEGKNALDSAAFHYSIYRSLTRFLGMDGILASGYDTPIDWVDSWNEMLITNDMINPNTNTFDARHMYGVSNQDVFRWPSIKNGTAKQLLASFITTLHMPGIPMILWGEEQGFYVLDNTATNYIFGRQAMSAATAWETHGCYKLGAEQFNDFPVEAALTGCNDTWNSLDHRDPSSPIRNIMKSMYQMRENYPVLNDGLFLQRLSKQTREIQLPGSNGTATELGMWSTVRGRFDTFQDFTGQGQGNQSIWLVYQNDNSTINYKFNCSSNDTALIAPFDTGTIVKNLFYPFDEVTLKDGPIRLGIEGSTALNGCLDQFELPAWGYKAYVPQGKWVGVRPMITKFKPGHDQRLTSTVAPGKNESVEIEVQFSAEMDCNALASSIEITSTTESKITATLDDSTVRCEIFTGSTIDNMVGSVPSMWRLTANLTNVWNGVHSVTIRNAITLDGSKSTKSTDTFLFRIGQPDNPIIFPRQANYTLALLHKDSTGNLYVSHKAAGADSWRYTLDWTTYSDWMPYYGGNSTLAPKNWTGTTLQAWSGEHVILQYYNRLSGSSDYFQHGDLITGNQATAARRFPNLFAQGPYNQYGYDAGLDNEFRQDSNGIWRFNFLSEWPGILQLNMWGINPDGNPDQSIVFGDADGDSILDRMPPSSLSATVINITIAPPSPYLGWTIAVNDGDLRFDVLPVGSQHIQIAIFVAMLLVPIITAGASVWAFMGFFYSVKFNRIGISEKGSILPIAIRRYITGKQETVEEMSLVLPGGVSADVSNVALAVDAGSPNRRTVLIATMEYDIEDWNIKIKIGGLGVMAQLMGKNLSHQDLIWVVPCVGDVEYPRDESAESIFITILGQVYEVEVQYHKLRNITYVLLDAPVFRAQSKKEPYPARMDDLESAVYYSSWNQCIAQVMRRFPIDLYHINDYHGAAAALHLLPERTIPVCLSLHNAEFQGLWPLRTQKEFEEVCAVYNLKPSIVKKYVQFGDVFNLLHAGSSYLRLHQKGFGAVGVSKKYGARSHARYPIFWGLSKVGQLPNPDPTDTADWSGQQDTEEVVIDEEFEASRAELKRQAQEWAGLDQNPDADLLVFVGRWSMQKGIDLIADIMPAILEERPNVQLLTIGPVIDLYGKFAALKLDVMMKKYKGRVFSKPEFTNLPPFVFSGAEFALIPSRDEPFGLVAVEFGRKGALGIGARVGGLGQMPGWWFTVESTTTSHMLHQFKTAINEALASKPEVRRYMRAKSAKQRFPVAAWVSQLEALQSTAIKIHDKEAQKTASNVSSDSARGRTRLRKSIPPVASSSTGPPRTRAALEPRAHSADRIDVRVSEDEDGEVPVASTRLLSMELRRPRRKFEGRAHFDLTGDDESDFSSKGVLQQPRISTGTSNTTTLQSILVSRSPSASPEALKPTTPESEEISQPSQLYLTPETANPNDGQITTPRKSIFREDVPQHVEDLITLAPLLKIQDLRPSSSLSLSSIVGTKTDFALQKVEPDFTDSRGDAYKAFETLLDKLNGETSEGQLCIEEFLVKSERKWYNEFKAVKLGLSSNTSSRTTSIFRDKEKARDPSVNSTAATRTLDEEKAYMDQWLLGDDYEPPTGLKLIMQYRIGDWPVYSLFLAFGQIVAANSYQVTLISGTVGETADKLYVVASIYLATSAMWWVLFRSVKSVYVLSVPFVFYSLAFVLLGIAPFAPTVVSRGWVQNIATGMYATASSSGSIFFALNFGDEGGAPVKSWVYRACIVQGTQQVYVCVLWAWGDYLSSQTASGNPNPSIITTSSAVMTAITLPIAALFFTVALLLYFGLPKYYRQAPGQVPSFYAAMFRRKIVIWFFIVVLIQNYFLSASTGRNWQYLWSSSYSSIWQIALLIFLFFVLIWTALLLVFGRLSKDHSWILPLFAVGLGAPRWAQILFSCSGIGIYLPWAGSNLGSALLSRSLWLWLGTLDALQGVGFGMILLQTLTRLHIAYTLIVAQILGSLATIAARATAPNRLGPGDAFPDFSTGAYPGVGKAWFWVGLVGQLVVCVGFFRFFRKEQLSKP